MFFKQLKPAILLFVLLTLLTGFVYPFFVTSLGQILFGNQANGSFISQDGKIIGSSLIGQNFSDPKYFWGRPSAAFEGNSGMLVSSGSNLGPQNAALKQAVAERIQKLQTAAPENKNPIPVDLVTTSASGVDPHISVAAALYQAPRVARARGISEEEIKTHIRQNTNGRFLGFIGEPTVHVLQLNRQLDAYQK